MDTHALLLRHFGLRSFRPGQEALIDAALAGRDALGVMPTGAGKSLCYQLPALMLPGLTLVVSPLISLMKDQVAALKQAGVAAAYINSSLTPGQVAEAMRRAALRAYKIIYVAPERLDTPSFLAFAQAAPISMVTVDEAHCVSQWGPDFRPSYLRIAQFVKALAVRPILSAFTATATHAVRRDIADKLGLLDPVCVVGGFDRPNLRFCTYKPRNRLDALVELVTARPTRCGIVYCATRKAVEQVCATLRAHGLDATRYHAGLSDAERQCNQEDFQYDRSQVMVATNAFGMGIDKSNVSYVLHYNMPLSVEAYYQEAGRAGRDGAPAECILLYASQDVPLGRMLIERGRSGETLDAAQYAIQQAHDLQRLREMTFYSTSKGCLRAFLLGYFGENPPAHCGNCSHCLKLSLREQTRQIAADKARKGRAKARASSGDALFDALKARRIELAREKHVPAYVICSDATLSQMAASAPRTLDDMRAIHGIGEIKLEQYGALFLEVVARHRGDG